MSTSTCPNCDTLLQITLSLDNLNTDNQFNNQNQVNQIMLNTETPDDVTETDDATDKVVDTVDNAVDNTADNAEDNAEEVEEDLVNYELLISKVENDQTLTDEELASINIKRMIKTDYYKSLKNKSVIKKKIIDMIEDMSNSDSNSDCYQFCCNCGFSRKTENGFVIATRYSKSGSINNENKFFDKHNVRNKKQIRTYRRTRQFKCGNPNCPSNNGKPPEASMIREKGSYRMIYVCAYKSCGYIKRL